MATPDFRMETAADGSATLDLFGAIGSGWLDDFDDSDIAEQMRELPAGAPLTVRLNSPGGSVFAAMAIKRLLEARAAVSSVTIEVVGLAASAATLITCAIGCPVSMATGAMMLIHPVRLDTFGADYTADELREAADGLEKVRESIRAIYRARTGLEDAQLDGLMDKESYLTADEAIAMHFADAKLPESAPAAQMASDRVIARDGERVHPDAARIRAALQLFEAPKAAETAPERAEKAEAAQTPAQEENGVKNALLAPVAKAPQAASAEAIAQALAVERARVSAIEELSEGLRGCDDLIRSAKADGSSVEAFAVAALRRLKTFPAVAFGARLSDAAELADLVPPGNDGLPLPGEAAAQAADEKRKHFSKLAADAAARAISTHRG